MPKTYYTPRKLPPEQPDRCELCPLVGIIPDDERRKGVRERSLPGSSQNHERKRPTSLHYEPVGRSVMWGACHYCWAVLIIPNPQTLL